MKEYFFTLFLRGSSLAARFFLVFFLAKFFNLNLYGIYGVIVAFIGYGIYLIGFDFYAYSTREMISSTPDKWGGMIYSHLFFGFLIIILFSPLLFFLYKKNIIPEKYFFYFFFILFLEWLNQELMRILIATKDPLSASIAYFIRSALWIFFIVIVFLLFENSRKLEFLFFSWIFFDAFAIAYVINQLIKNGVSFHNVFFDWRWVLKGVKVSLLFFIGTLCLRGVSTFDRYYISEFLSYEKTAIYVLFSGLSGALQIILDAGVFTFLYPRLISSFNDGDFKKFNAILKKIIFSVILISFSFSLALYSSIDVFLNLINKNIYRDNIEILWYCLLCNIIWAFSMIFHYPIYAFNKDRVIFFSHATGLVTFLVVLGLNMGSNSLVIVPLAVAFSFSIVLFIKAIFFFVTKKRLEKDFSMLRDK